MYKYRSKYDVRKLNSALKDIDNDLSIGTQAHHSSGAVTVKEGTCWSPSIWRKKKPLHPYISQKNIREPAPHKNSNDYWCFIYDQKTSGSNFLQTSVILTVSTQCYTKGHYKEGDIHTNLRCCSHCPATLHPLLVENQSL